MVNHDGITATTPDSMANAVRTNLHPAADSTKASALLHRNRDGTHVLLPSANTGTQPPIMAKAPGLRKHQELIATQLAEAR